MANNTQIEYNKNYAGALKNILGFETLINDALKDREYVLYQSTLGSHKGGYLLSLKEKGRILTVRIDENDYKTLPEYIKQYHLKDGGGKKINKAMDEYNAKIQGMNDELRQSTDFRDSGERDSGEPNEPSSDEPVTYCLSNDYYKPNKLNLIMLVKRNSSDQPTRVVVPIEYPYPQGNTELRPLVNVAKIMGPLEGVFSRGTMPRHSIEAAVKTVKQAYLPQQNTTADYRERFNEARHDARDKSTQDPPTSGMKPGGRSNR